MVPDSADDELVFIFILSSMDLCGGFRPAAYGTEKFMDYGFMMAMMRSTTLPAKDLWYAGAKNQLLLWRTVFCCILTKLTNTRGGTDVQSGCDTGVQGFVFRSVCLGTPDGT